MQFKKSVVLFVFLLLTVLVISSCGVSHENGQRRTYDLKLEVAGDGSIRDAGRDRHITSISRTLKLDRNSVIELKAEAGWDESIDFLFWAGNFSNLALEPKQSIYMDNNKELIAVFGDFNRFFMGGDISRAWNNSNVIGYWKAMISDEDLEEKGFDEGALELYIRETTGFQRKESYIFDEEVFASNTGEIFFKRATDQFGNVDPANFEYIAAILRIEETKDLRDEEFKEYNRLLFVFSDQRGIEVLILPDDDPGYREIFEDTLDLYDSADEFKEEVKRIIYEYKDKEEYIIGNTFDINDPF